MSTDNDYRARSGLAPWQGNGPGLFEVNTEDPAGAKERMVTNVRRIAGADRTPGSALIGTAGWLLTVLAGGLLAVSYAGQFTYIFAARGQVIASNIEAAMFDTGMIIFSLLALGLARAGKPARTERMLILVCSLGSAGMGYAAADVTSPRSVAAYVAPPLFLAVVVDRVIAVVRRHILGDEETSPWTVLGRVALGLARGTGLVALYLLRLALDPKDTPGGLRRVVLNAAPLPAKVEAVPQVRWAAPPDQPAIDGNGTAAEAGGGTKKAALIALYEQRYAGQPEHGDRAQASRIATELCGEAGLQAGSARSYLYAYIDGLAS